MLPDAVASLLRDLVELRIDGSAGRGDALQELKELQSRAASVLSLTGDDDQPHLCILAASPLVYLHPQRRTYEPLDHLDQSKEYDVVKRAFLDSGHRVRALRAVGTIDNLRAALDARCAALHISCHGIVDDGGKEHLLFENPHGAAHMVDADMIYSILSHARYHPPRLVFLASCHSQRLGHAIVAAGVRHVVVIKRDERVLDTVRCLLRPCVSFLTAPIARPHASSRRRSTAPWRWEIRWKPRSPARGAVLHRTQTCPEPRPR